jgi:hypothetical protein
LEKKTVGLYISKLPYLVKKNLGSFLSARSSQEIQWAPIEFAYGFHFAIILESAGPVTPRGLRVILPLGLRIIIKMRTTP